MDDDVTAVDIRIGPDETELGITRATEISCDDATMVVLVVKNGDCDGTYVGVHTSHPLYTGAPYSGLVKRSRAMERAKRNLLKIRAEAAEARLLGSPRRIMLRQAAE